MRLLNIHSWLEILCINSFSQSIPCPNRSPPQRKCIHSHPTPSGKPQIHSDKRHSCREWKTTLTPHLIWSLIFCRSDVHFQFRMKRSHLWLITNADLCGFVLITQIHALVRVNRGPCLNNDLRSRGPTCLHFWFNPTVNLSCKFVPVIIHKRLQCFCNVSALKHLVPFVKWFCQHVVEAPSVCSPQNLGKFVCKREYQVSGKVLEAHFWFSVTEEPWYVLTIIYHRRWLLPCSASCWGSNPHPFPLLSPEW